jgi:Immunity protein 8
MRAKLKRIHSPDVFDLASWEPPTESFAILLQLMVGPDGDPGEESFDLTLCSIGWLEELLRTESIVDLRYHLLVERYDFRQLTTFLEDRVSTCAGSTWGEVALQVGRLGRWEFESYVEQA